MINIPLYQKTELPPERAGIAKPPYSLADTSGQRQLGRLAAGFGEKIWAGIIQAQAANEVAAGRGQLNTFLEGYNTYVADNPNISPEELKKQWSKVNAQIKTIPSTMKTAPAKRDMTNFLALNESLYTQKALTMAATTRTKQERAKADAQLQIYKAGGETDKAIAFVDEQVENRVYSEEEGKLFKAVDIPEMERVKQEALIQNAIRFEPETALALIEQSGLPEKHKTALWRQANAAISRDKNKAEEQINTYITQTFKQIASELTKNPRDTTTIDMLEGSELKTHFQNLLAEREEKLDRKKSPVDIFKTHDPIYYNSIKEQIREDPDSVDYVEDVAKKMGHGLTPDEVIELGELQDEMQRKDSPLAQSHIKRAHDRIDGLKDNKMPIEGIEAPDEDSAPEDVMKYMDAVDKMHDEIDAKAREGITPEDARKLTAELVAPVSEDYAQSVIEKALGFAIRISPVGMGISIYKTKEHEKQFKQLPIDAQIEFRKAYQRYKTPLGLFLKEFRSQKKLLTPEIARHYLDIADNREEAIKIAHRDGYYE